MRYAGNFYLQMHELWIKTGTGILRIPLSCALIQFGEQEGYGKTSPTDPTRIFDIQEIKFVEPYHFGKHCHSKTDGVMKLAAGVHDQEAAVGKVLSVKTWY